MTLQEQIATLESERITVEAEERALFAIVEDLERKHSQARSGWCPVFQRLASIKARLDIARQMLESFEAGKEQSECKTN